MKAEMDIGLARRTISIRKARLDETNVDQQEARSFLARVDILGALERTVLISINLSKISLIIIRVPADLSGGGPGQAAVRG